MPAGLQVFSPSGNLWVDTSTWLGRWYGARFISGASGSSSFPEMVGKGRAFTWVPTYSSTDTVTMPDGYTMSSDIGADVRITNEATKQFSWGFTLADYVNPGMTFYYGAF